MLGLDSKPRFLVAIFTKAILVSYLCFCVTFSYSSNVETVLRKLVLCVLLRSVYCKWLYCFHRPLIDDGFEYTSSIRVQCYR